MKRSFVLFATFSYFALSASFAQADTIERSWFDSMVCIIQFGQDNCGLETEQKVLVDAWSNFAIATTDAKSVPELDGAGAPIAAALVAGLVGLKIERRRRQRVKVKA